jgi:hypothetical protein
MDAYTKKSMEKRFFEARLLLRCDLEVKDGCNQSLS